MRRMLGLELKRLFKARMVRILLAASLVLAVGMAMLVVSFTEYYYLDEQGNQARVTGGIRDILTAREMLRLGASRIGCSASAAIMESLK